MPRSKAGMSARSQHADAVRAGAGESVMPVAGSDARESQVSRPAETLESGAVSTGTPAAPRPNHVGTVSLLCAVAGTAACWAALAAGPFAGAVWIRIVTAGFEAATVGALADWFAVTALFRHPLRAPIPHTGVIPTRRVKLIESIVSVVENDWLSPDVIGARLARFAPSE